MYLASFLPPTCLCVYVRSYSSLSFCNSHPPPPACEPSVLLMHVTPVHSFQGRESPRGVPAQGMGDGGSSFPWHKAKQLLCTPKDPGMCWNMGFWAHSRNILSPAGHCHISFQQGCTGSPPTSKIKSCLVLAPLSILFPIYKLPAHIFPHFQWAAGLLLDTCKNSLNILDSSVN
jgi:hypothetical protein